MMMRYFICEICMLYSLFLVCKHFRPFSIFKMKNIPHFFMIRNSYFFVFILFLTPFYVLSTFKSIKTQVKWNLFVINRAIRVKGTFFGGKSSRFVSFFFALFVISFLSLLFQHFITLKDRNNLHEIAKIRQKGSRI